MITGLAGRWKVIGCQLHGTWLRPSIFSEFVYIIKEDGTYFIGWANLTYEDFHGGFRKSDTGKLEQVDNHLDFLPDKGKFAGRALQSIFDLDHDILKLNVAFEENARPDKFTAKQGQVYEIWQRIG